MMMIARSIALTTILMWGGYSLIPNPPSALRQTQVEAAIDLLQRTAQDATVVNPPAMSAQAASLITNWRHISSIVVNTQNPGWKDLVVAQVDTMMGELSLADRALLDPYATLIKTLCRQGEFN